MAIKKPKGNRRMKAQKPVHYAKSRAAKELGKDYPKKTAPQIQSTTMSKIERELSEEEVKAIQSLKKLAKKWPQSLFIFCHGGGISIRKPLKGESPGAQTEVDSVSGIPNDGGDGGDVF
jgi:hypothetical protein